MRAMSVLDTLEDEALMGASPVFADLTPWRPWLTFLRCVYGLPLDEGQRKALPPVHGPKSVRPARGRLARSGPALILRRSVVGTTADTLDLSNGTRVATYSCLGNAAASHGLTCIPKPRTSLSALRDVGTGSRSLVLCR